MSEDQSKRPSAKRESFEPYVLVLEEQRAIQHLVFDFLAANQAKDVERMIAVKTEIERVLNRALGAK